MGQDVNPNPPSKSTAEQALPGMTTMQNSHRLAAILQSRKLSKRRLLRSLAAATLATGTRLSPWTTASGRAQPALLSQQAAGLPTPVTVRVIANGGKYLGDDIGGALVTIRDANTGEVLASGVTHGGSGPADLMSVGSTRTEPVPDEDAASFQATLRLEGPRQVQIEALGPLAAPGSTGRASTTRWLLPGDTAPHGNWALVTLDGLVVQVLNPPTHFQPTTPPPLDIDFRANVTMMCGCPIGPGEPWLPQDFQVTASISNPDGSQDHLTLIWDSAAPNGAPSQFVGVWTAHASGVYAVTVTAVQPLLGNVGVDRVTFIVP
jgi:hypothetical protein